MRQTFALVIALISRRAEFIRVDGVDITFTAKWKTLALIVTLVPRGTQFIGISGVDITFTARIETSEQREAEVERQAEDQQKLVFSKQDWKPFE